MATGDILSVSVNSDGWSATVTIEGFVTGASYDFGTPGATGTSKFYLSVVSEGYDNTGSLGTIARTVYGTDVVRIAGTAGLDETVPVSDLVVRVALSDCVYDDDKNGGAGTSGTDPTATIAAGWCTNAGGSSELSAAVSGGSVTNNSTLDYPVVIGNWAVPPYRAVTADFLLEAVCFHKHAKGGSPVACVKFDAADQSTNTSAQQTVTAMTVSTWGTDAKSVSVYAATMDIDALDDAEVIDCRFRAYPWVGDANSILDTDTGTAAPSALVGPHKLLNDKGNTYGRYIAVVSSGGNDGTGVASTTLATADASPFLTIGAAMNAISTANSKFDNGTVYLRTGSYTFFGTAPSGTHSTQAWLTIATHPSDAARSAKLTTFSSSRTLTAGFLLKIENVDIESTDANCWFEFNTLYNNGAWLHDCTLEETGADTTTDWPMRRAEMSWLTQCDVADWHDMKPFSTDQIAINYRGNTFAAPCVEMQPNFCVGNEFTGDTRLKQRTTALVIQNAIVAWNRWDSFNATSARAIELGDDPTTGTFVGYGIVGNVFESISGTGSLVYLFADGVVCNSTHLCLWHNTIKGERINIGYNDQGTTAYNHILYSIKYNHAPDWNTKHDLFGTPSANRIGGWPVSWMVGAVGNDIASPLGFPPDYWGIDQTAATGTFEDDQSQDSAGSGGGDYTPASGSTLLSRVPSGESVIPFDLFGNAISDSGTGAAGAVQIAAVAAGGSSDEFMGLGLGLGV